MANRYSLEASFDLIDNVTKKLDNIGIKCNVVGNALKKDLAKGQKQLDQLGKAAVKAGAAIAAAGAAAVTAWAVKGVKDAIEYDTALRKVSTVADTTKVSLDDLSKGLMKISNETGTAVSELAEMQYNAIVSGISTADSVAFVGTAVKAAEASFTDSAIVIDGLTSVMNAYGLQASEADKIAGQMLITNNMGKTSFQELNGALGKVLPTAARLNVGTDELFASITALTANSIETPKAVKGLEKILESVQKPSKGAAEAAKKLGIDFSVAALRSKGFAGFMEDIKNKAGGNEAAIMELFGSVESLNAITVLTGKGAGQFTDALNAMQNATETLDSAFETIDASPAERWGDIVNIIKNAGISLGTKLLPVIEKATEKVEGVVGKLQNIDFTPIANKIGIVFDKLLKVANFIISLVGIIWKLRVPILAIVAAVALYRGGMLIAAAAVNGFTAAQNIAKGVQLAAALITGNQTKAMALYKAGTMGATVQTTLFWVRQKAAAGVELAGTLIKQGAAFIVLKAQLIAAKVATVAFAVAQKAAALASKVAAAAQWVLNAAMTANPIGLIIAGIVALIAIVILCVKNWDKITAALKIAWDWIKKVAGIIRDSLVKAFEALTGVLSIAWEWIKKVAGMIWDGLCKAFETLAGFIKENSEKVLALITIFMGPFGFIISIVKELKDNWGAVVEAFKTDGIIAGLQKLGGVILSAILAPIQGFLEMLSQIPLIEDKIAPAAEKIKGFRDQLKGVETENTVIQNVVPGDIRKPVIEPVTQTVNASASVVSVDNTSPRPVFPGNPAPNRLNRTIPAMADNVPAPMTRTTSPVSPAKPPAPAPVSIPGRIETAAPRIDNPIRVSTIPDFNVTDKLIPPVPVTIGKIEGLEKLENLTADVRINNVVPGEINKIVQEQPAKNTPTIPSYGVNNRNVQVTPPASPMTRTEQSTYSQTVNKEQLDINVKSESGSSAQVTRRPRSPNVRVSTSGGNNGRR